MRKSDISESRILDQVSTRIKWYKQILALFKRLVRFESYIKLVTIEFRLKLELEILYLERYK